MNKENKPVKNLNTPEELRKRNIRAVLRTFVILTVVVTLVVLVRTFVQNKGNSFGSVNGISTGEDSGYLTKINFVDSGVSRSTKVFGNIQSSFINGSDSSLWLEFKSSDKTIVGYLDKDLKFTKVYELPFSVRLVKLLSDKSILFTDEPSKEQPALYYQTKNSDTVRFSSLDFQDTYLSIYFDPSEKLIYYLGKDNANTFFLYSVNEKGKESNIFKTGDLTDKSRIIYIDSNNAYLQDEDTCYTLGFANKQMTQLDCGMVKRNDLGKVYSVYPKIMPVYSEVKAGELLEVNTIDGSKKSIFKLSDGLSISKLSYASNKIVFSKSSLNPVADNTFLPKDVSLMVLDLESLQVTEVATRLPSDSVSDYFTFADKYFAVAGTNNTKLLQWVPSGQAGQVYVGDVAPVSYTTVTKYWVDINLGESANNIYILKDEFTL